MVVMCLRDDVIRERIVLLTDKVIEREKEGTEEELEDEEN
jgi:hypothetical protein